MSDASNPIQDELEAAAAFGAGPKSDYGLSSDLARLCLPAEFKDYYRKLAWVDSICFLFLIVGLIGIKPSRIIERPLSQPQDVVPVVFTPPEEQQKPQPEVKQDEPEPKDQPLDTPAVAPIVAAVDSPAVAFSVPVAGAVAVAAPRYATPPPPVNQAPRFTKFDPNAYGSGNYPAPLYPGFAERNHYQGTVTLEIRLTDDWQVGSVQVVKSSGYTVLDDAAVRVVKTSWRFAPPLPGKLLIWECKFELK